MEIESVSINHAGRYWSALQEINLLDGAEQEARIRGIFGADVAWHGPHPINDLDGVDRYIEQFWRPFKRAFPDVERRADIFFEGTFKGGEWVCSTGHYVGTFAAPWLGIPATGGATTVRYGEFCRFESGRIVETYVILDLLDVMRQARVWPLAPSLGAEGLVPGPATRDGVRLVPDDVSTTQQSLHLVEAMIAGLMEFDGSRLESMRIERFWDPHMMWYGPSGIGTSRGIKGFQDVHQRSFLEAFPDRRGGDHKARLAAGPYVGSTGWPSVRATHSGGDWLGCPPGGRKISMRVMDFWRREDDLLVENWVFIDMIELLLQMGVDVFARLRSIYPAQIIA